MAPDLLDRLRSQLRRDPSDGDVAFLISLAVRDPFVVYTAERTRLRRLIAAQGRSARELLLAEAAEHLVVLASTPSGGVRRPESGPMQVVPRGDDETGGAADAPLRRTPKKR